MNIIEGKRYKTRDGQVTGPVQRSGRGAGCLACVKITIDCEEGEGL